MVTIDSILINMHNVYAITLYVLQFLNAIQIKHIIRKIKHIIRRF